MDYFMATSKGGKDLTIRKLLVKPFGFFDSNFEGSRGFPKAP